MTNTDAVKSIKSRLAGLKRGRRFIDYHESGSYARVLETIVDEIDSQAESPRQGIELVAAFIQTDSAVLSRADDSDGSIGDVYRIFASESFTSHASQCEDKEWLYDLTLKLYRQDEFEVRDSVIANAAAFLPESYLRRMVDEFWALGAQEAGEFKRYHWYLAIESIARQLKDPALFEKACRAKWPDLPVAGHFHIAKAYHESGFPLVALHWLDKVPSGEMFQLDERERLLLSALMDLGNRGRAEEVAWKLFHRSRSKERLSLLLNVIDEPEKEHVIHSEIALVLESPTLDYVDASFLLGLERFADAERYLTERSA